MSNRNTSAIEKEIRHSFVVSPLIFDGLGTTIKPPAAIFSIVSAGGQYLGFLEIHSEALRGHPMHSIAGTPSNSNCFILGTAVKRKVEAELKPLPPSAFCDLVRGPWCTRFVTFINTIW